MSVVVDLEAWESLRRRPPKLAIVALVLKDMVRVGEVGSMDVVV